MSGSSPSTRAFQEWTELTLNEKCGKMQISNPNVILPSGLSSSCNVLRKNEIDRLLQVLDQNESKWFCEGFQERKRVQRYSTPLEYEELNWLVDRIMVELNGRDVQTEEEEESVQVVGAKAGVLYPRPQELVIEERMVSKESKQYDNLVTTFESCPNSKDAISPCEKSSKDCNCYVAQLTLLNSCIQSINKPKERDVQCWHLESVDHCTDFVMEPNSLTIKKGECLWSWRSSIKPMRKIVGKDELADRIEDRILTIQARYLNDDSNTSSNDTFKSEIEGSPTEKISSLSLERHSLNCISLPELLTIIVTTSPIKSNPSTEVLERTFATFRFAGEEFAYFCPKLIICDGCRILESEDKKSKKVTRKHANAKQALRNGIATNDQSKKYQQFKAALKGLCRDADLNESLSSPFKNTRVVELSERHGYGFALKHALTYEVTTPYVCVIQHDRTFMRETPIKDAIQAMINDTSGDIKYIGMNMRSNLTYRDIFLTKYGRPAFDELFTMVKTPRELALDSATYGPNGSSVKNFDFQSIKNEKLIKNIHDLAHNYTTTLQFISNGSKSEFSNEVDADKHQLSLTPTLFWYDNTHLCLTSHYRDFIFDPKYRMVARGGFVEDKLSPAITKHVEKIGLTEGHRRFGCYLLDDHSGYYFTGHLDGGSFMTDEEKAKLRPKC